METALLDWLKANIVLALFAGAYYGLLRQLTFFGLNRAFLLFAVVFAAAYPWLRVPALLPAGMGPQPLPLVAGHLAWPPRAAAGAPGGWGPYLLGSGAVLYLAGVGALLLRLLGQLLSLAQLRRRSRPATVRGQAVRVVPGGGGPFSFGSTIYLPEEALANSATLPAALRHEQAHVRQAHTLDVLLLQVATALAWPNPAAWLLRRATLDNLEYLADRATLSSSDLSRRAYQYLLLRQQAGEVPAPALALRIEFRTLKNRIAMLGQPPSGGYQRGRYLLAAPLVVALALGFAGARAQPALATPARAASLPPDLMYYLDAAPSTPAAVQALDPATLESIDMVKDPALLRRYFGGATGAAILTTKAHANSPAVLAMVEEMGLASGYVHTPAEVNALVPKALAYITSHYPDARLSGEVTAMQRKTTGATQYRVQLVTGRRPFYVFFSPQGEFLGGQ